VVGELAYDNAVLFDRTFGPHAMSVLAEGFDANHAPLSLVGHVGEFWERKARGHAA
jgi:hypothetical protein